MDATPAEEDERLAKLKEQRQADRARRRQAHEQARAEPAAPGEPARAEPAAVAPVARAIDAPVAAVLVADVAPVEAIAVLAPPAPVSYPDVDAQLLGAEVARERTRLDGFQLRATAVCGLLREAERKLAEAERMAEASLELDGENQ